MAFMKFYVGNEANASSHRDGIYIAIDTKKIFYNGDAYGGGDVDLNNYVTLDGEQTITGRKTFNDCIIVKHTPSAENGNTAFSISKPNTSGGFKVELVRDSSSVSSAKVTIHNGTNALDWNNAALRIISGLNSNGSSYGVRITYGGILVEGDPNSSDDRDMIINHEGITISGKTTSDLLNAGGGTISIDELKSQLNIPDTSALQGAIGTNVYTGANYISKETNLTDAVLQLDVEIKATNDNLALEHTNAEATYAKKTELGKKLDISTYTSDKATFALKSEIPDVSNFLTISNAQSTYLTKTDARNTYQPKGNYLTSVSIATISDLNSGWDALLKAAPNIPSLNGYATQEWVNGRGFLTKTTADGYYQPKGNYLTSVSWSQVSDKPAFAAVATSGSYNDLTNKPTIPNVSTVNHSGTISLVIDSNTLTFKSDGIAFNGATIITVPVVEVLSTEEINQILNS